MDTGERKMKRAVIVTKSTNYEPRAEVVGEYLKSRGEKVTYIYSNYSHREKKKLHRSEPDHIYIDTFPYRKNLSWQRIWSQIDFAKKTGKTLRGLDYDLLYVLIPGNSLVPMGVNAVRDKADRPKLVFDVIDLWPESLGLGKLERLWPFTYWKKLRDRDISKADLIITECDLYREKLKLDPKKSVTMYWGKKDTAGITGQTIKAEEGNGDLEIAYLGAINNIIDMDGIVGLLCELNKGLEIDKRSVLLHVIGDGENRDAFLQELDTAGIRYIYHGAVFDEAEKESILSRCSYGLNMMKPGVCVGMTMKSIDYWSHGLPVINNIPGDTRNMCERNHMGINAADPGIEDTTYCISAILGGVFTDRSSRQHIKDFYERNLTVRAMYRVLDGSLPEG